MCWGLFLCLAPFILSCETSQKYASPAQSSAFIPQSFDWSKEGENIFYFRFENKSIPLIYHVIKIDLNASAEYSILLEASPEDSLEKSLSTKDFAKKLAREGHKNFIAINTSPFTGGLFSESHIVGAHRVNNITTSPIASRYAALALNTIKNGTTSTFDVSILPNQSHDIEEYEYAFGGFFAILLEGKEMDFAVESFDSRTSLGYDREKNIIYILLAEGERKRKSIGLSYQQSAKIFKALECVDALEFDGGSSSASYINGRRVLSYPDIRAQKASIAFIIKMLEAQSQ